MKFRQPAAALLSVALFLSLTVSCAEAADPLPDVQAHVLKSGFRNTNPAFTPPSTSERIKYIASRSWATTVHPRSVNLPRVEYDVFKEIGTRLGPFDLAAVPIGAYLPRAIMKMTHLAPEEALQLLADLQGERLVAIHWGTFDLTEEPIEEPPQRLEVEARRRGLDLAKVWVLKHGETRSWSRQDLCAWRRRNRTHF